MLFTCLVKSGFLSRYTPTFFTISENLMHWSPNRIPLMMISLSNEGGYKSSNSVLSGLIFMKWKWLHSTISFIQLTTSCFRIWNWNFSANERLPLESSANDEVLNSQCWKTIGCDRTFMLKSGGPSTDPCGVPHGTSKLSENSSPTFTLWVLTY